MARVEERGFRRRARDFSRDGVLSPRVLLSLLLYMVGDGNRRGYGHMLAAFWDEARSHDLELPGDGPVSAAAFCQARGKLRPAFLRALLHDVGGLFAESFTAEATWRGRRVFAIDGCRINLQRSPELHARFGTPAGAYCPQVLVSTLLDVAGRVPRDVAVAPHATSERALVAEHLRHLRPGDILLLDRGYPSFEILRQLLAARIDFVIRVPASHSFAAVDVFRQSGGDDYRIRIEPPDKASHDAEAIELRAVRSVTVGQDPVIYLTSLRRSAVTWSEICQLYRMRWEAEEFFKVLKSPYLDPRQFHSKSPAGVEQEILATHIYVAIARCLMGAAARNADVPYQEMSPKAGVLALAVNVTRIFLASGEAQPHGWFTTLLERIAWSRNKRRPHRRYPRRSFRPTPRWGPNGRRGG